MFIFINSESGTAANKEIECWKPCNNAQLWTQPISRNVVDELLS